MKHATAQTLSQIGAILKQIRQYSPLKEKKSGIFYQKSTAFLHFHEDPAGLFADLRTARTWKRLAVNTPSQVQILLRAVEKELGITTPNHRKSRHL